MAAAAGRAGGSGAAGGEGKAGEWGAGDPPGEGVRSAWPGRDLNGLKGVTATSCALLPVGGAGGGTARDEGPAFSWKFRGGWLTARRRLGFKKASGWREFSALFSSSASCSRYPLSW